MDDLNLIAEQVGAALKSRGMMLASAESCTGGWVGEAVTSVAGSSHWYDRGFITYTNESKQEMLGVAANTLAEFGAVSEQTVREMAAGALKHSRAGITLAISGIAGPGGGTPNKPVGTVCMAWATRSGAGLSQSFHFQGDRTAVRRQAVVAALQGVLRMIEGEAVTA
ncbi:MAG: nicotinamide-nucleotide amidohydrolase family protein [Burkholderiales bacterium]|nr:nicotinamide-nucleotide amidohydrolase family protein [Burkholderiales bacterium]